MAAHATSAGAAVAGPDTRAGGRAARNLGSAHDPAPLPVDGIGAMTDRELLSLRERAAWEPSGSDAVRLLATIDRVRLDLAFVTAERDRFAVELQVRAPKQRRLAGVR